MQIGITTTRSNVQFSPRGIRFWETTMPSNCLYHKSVEPQLVEFIWDFFLALLTNVVFWMHFCWLKLYAFIRHYQFCNFLHHPDSRCLELFQSVACRNWSQIGTNNFKVNLLLNFLNLYENSSWIYNYLIK